LSAEKAASAAAIGAVEAAETIGGETGKAIKKVVTGTISGIKVVVKEPFRKKNNLRRVKK